MPSTIQIAFRHALLSGKLDKAKVDDDNKVTDIVLMSLKAFNIILEKRIDIDELIECRNYKEFVKSMKEYYDMHIDHLGTVTKEWWLDKWLIDENTFDYLREVIKWNS